MRRGLLVVGSTLGVAALVAAASPRTAAASSYEAQLEHDQPTFSLTDGRAGAVTFSTEAGALERFGAWVGSRSDSGTVTASVRTEVADPATEVATATRDLGELGGTGLGWLEFDFEVPLSQAEYSVVLQADGTSDDVVWYGNRARVEEAIPSWNHDADFWDGWVQYGVGEAAHFADRNLAFYINDSLTPGGCAAANECWRALPTSETFVEPAGLIGAPGSPHALTAFEAAGAEYVDGSSVLATQDGQWLYVPPGVQEPAVVPTGHAGAAAQIAESREWLAAGEVPGTSSTHRDVATRALLDMRLLLQENGAAAAAWHGIWKYSWPRDTAFMAAAFAHAGHLEEAHRILAYNDQTLRRHCEGRAANCVPGTWDARTLLDRSGPPDGRPWQLDANGFVPWAVWQYVEALPSTERAGAIAEFYDMVRLAANAAASSLGGDGLPPARPDYWESTYPATNLGTAAPLLAGLRASADLAVQAGRLDDAERWYAAADRLASGIEATFGQNGYQRTVVDGSGKDSAITWLVPPFNVASPTMAEAIEETWNVLLEPTGGIKPGEDWVGHASWTPETMFFALAWANAGETERSAGLVDWLHEHRTAVGAFPEKVTADGHPAAVSTLGWTASLALLTLEALETPLPTPPATMAASIAGRPAPAGGLGGHVAGTGGGSQPKPVESADGAGQAGGGLPVTGLGALGAAVTTAALLIGGAALRRRRSPRR